MNWLILHNHCNCVLWCCCIKKVGNSWIFEFTMLNVYTFNISTLCDYCKILANYFHVYGVFRFRDAIITRCLNLLWIERIIEWLDWCIINTHVVSKLTIFLYTIICISTVTTCSWLLSDCVIRSHRLSTVFNYLYSSITCVFWVLVVFDCRILLEYYRIKFEYCEVSLQL